MNNQDFQGIVIALLVYLAISAGGTPLLGPDVASIITMLVVGFFGLLVALFLFVYIGTGIESIIEKIQAVKFWK